jgi:UDP-N-acetylglucosamine 2-epimerase (non-hydrolysing)/GDP/UDP-N,N'-diacetylbacillosamine 2-epimerase (hydrolysing)
VIDVSGLSGTDVIEAVTKAKSTAFKDSLAGITNPYGDGKASTKTLETLKTVPLGQELMLKKFHEIMFDPLALGLGPRKET